MFTKAHGLEILQAFVDIRRRAVKKGVDQAPRSRNVNVTNSLSEECYLISSIPGLRALIF